MTQTKPSIPTLDDLRRQANGDNNALLAQLIGCYDAGYFRSYEDWLAFSLSRMASQATEYLAAAVNSAMLAPPPSFTLPAEALKGESTYGGAKAASEIFRKQLTGGHQSG